MRAARESGDAFSHRGYREIAQRARESERRAFQGFFVGYRRLGFDWKVFEEVGLMVRIVFGLGRIGIGLA